MSRSNDILRSTPPVTGGILAVCVLLYVIQVVSGRPHLQSVTLCPQLVIYLGDYYRIVTSALYHGGLMHVGMNMMSTAALGSMLEKHLGSIPLLFTLLWAILLTSGVYILIAFGMSALCSWDNLMYQHSVGFSGVLFHFSVLECNLFPHHSRSLFGFVTVPAFLYPWALLFLLQFIMPNLSFTGHLAGIITGTLQSMGFFNSWLLVSHNYMQEMESWNVFSKLVACPSYVGVPSISESTMRERQQSAGALLTATRQGFDAVGRAIKNMFEALWVVIFGRGAELNANIQLPTTWRSSSLSTFGTGITSTFSDGTEDDDDDDDWVGLPVTSTRVSVGQEVV